MHNAVHDMLQKYACRTSDDYRNALKEIIQEIALLGLYRGGFFDRAAFYGGTALRIFYGLNRFSEDLDFSLLEPDPGFTVAAYQKPLQDELASFGFTVEVTPKEKQMASPVESAFIKTGTRMNLIKIGLQPDLVQGVMENELLKVKIEVDTDPPPGAEFEVKYHLNPIPFHVRVCTLPVLFAGKLHALLCRNWGGGRVKGRDLYDYVWYVSREAAVDLGHLQARLKQTGHLPPESVLDFERLKQMLHGKFSLIDFTQAKQDVLPFIPDPEVTDLWSKNFFTGITADKLRTVN
ncbi:nucleotidyl transferase AbiEii/AbiGii toxin family protein [bacterium]|nr:nucleotidyl transferase AbiEii/AbiGii toxin family protein [bacterium]